jgi:hypothetical protein
MTDERYKHNKYKKKYLDSKSLHGGTISGETKENLMYLKKEGKDLNLRVVIGAGNIDVPGISEDYSRFSSNKYNVAVTNDKTLINPKTRDLIGLCLNFNDSIDTLTFGGVLANRVSHILFDYSVAKFISSPAVFSHLFKSLKTDGELIIDQTLTILGYDGDEILKIIKELDIKHGSVSGKHYVNHFMQAQSEGEMSSYLPTNDEIIENNKKYLENIQDDSHKFVVEKIDGAYPIPPYKKITGINKFTESVTYFKVTKKSKY